MTDDQLGRLRTHEIQRDAQVRENLESPPPLCHEDSGEEMFGPEVRVTPLVCLLTSALRHFIDVLGERNPAPGVFLQWERHLFIPMTALFLGYAQTFEDRGSKAFLDGQHPKQ